MNRPYPIVLLLLMVVGCNSDTNQRLEQIQSQLSAIDSLNTKISEDVNRSHSRVSYILSDIDRESKNVATVLSDHSFAKGDRIFLGDDMWDVMFVKAYGGNKLGEEAPWYIVGSVELLVKYAGKAKDRKSTG